MTKTCAACKLPFDLTPANFGKASRAPDGFKSRCVKCDLERGRKRREQQHANRVDPVLALTPFKRGDVVEWEGRQMWISHGMQSGFTARIALYPVKGVRKVRMVWMRQLVEGAKRVAA